MAEDNGNVNVQNVAGSQQEQINISLAEQQQQSAKEQDQSVTADSLGVTAEQFAKYFKDGAYDWQSHAKEAEFKLQKRGGAEEGNQQQAEATNGGQDGAAENAIQQAGLDMDVLTQKIADAGDIEDGDYEALKKIGIPEDIVKDYVDSVVDRAASHVKAVVEAFGGEEAYQAVGEFVRANYSAEEIKDLEAALSDPSKYKLTVDMLNAKVASSGRKKDTTVQTPNQSQGGANDSVKPYGSQMEMVADQRKPEYKTDPLFRQQVMDRARVSNFEVQTRMGGAGL